MVMYALFEHAAGYAAFKVNSNEEIGALLPQVQEAVVDLERFGRIVKLIAFSPFKNAANALEIWTVFQKVSYKMLYQGYSNKSTWSKNDLTKNIS